MVEKFTRKNDIGVNIEYNVIGYFKYDNNNYRIYTDFASDNNKIGIRLFVDIEKNKEFVPLNEMKAKRIITLFNKEILTKNSQ